MDKRSLSAGAGKHLFVITAAAFIACFGSICEASSWHEETSRKTIALEGERKLIINTKSGDVIVTGEKGAVGISLEMVKKVKAEDEEEAKRLISLMGIEIERDGDELLIKTKYPERRRGKKNIFSYLLQRYSRMSIELEVVIPLEMELEVETASGDISVSNTTGAVEITAASGDVEASNVEGSLIIGVSSGSIDVSRVTGEAELRSSSGDVVARHIAGDADVSTASGDVELSDIGGSLDLRTVSGDVEVDGVGAIVYKGVSGSVRFIDVRGGVSASAASGDLSLQLVPVANVDYMVRTSSGTIKFRFLEIMSGGYILDAGTTTGDISANLPINISKIGRNHISGVVRDGESKVVLETASGDISISEPEE